MVTDPFNSQPLEVRVEKEVTGEGRIVPTRPMYDPGKLLDFIKANGNRFSLFKLNKFFNGDRSFFDYKEPLILDVFLHFNLFGLMEQVRPVEFEEHPDGGYSTMYRLTEKGKNIDYAELNQMIATAGHSRQWPDFFLRALERGAESGDFESEFEKLSTEERRQLQFPNYKEN